MRLLIMGFGPSGQPFQSLIFFNPHHIDESFRNIFNLAFDCFAIIFRLIDTEIAVVVPSAFNPFEICVW